MTKNELPGSVRLWAAIVLTAVFIIGAASGAALFHACMKRESPHHPPMMGSVPIHELNLSDEQRAQVDKIIESYRPKLDAVLNETFPKVRAINEQIEKEVLVVLTDEQKKQFEKIKARRPPNDMHNGPFHGAHEGPFHGMRDLPPGPPPGPPGDLTPPPLPSDSPMK
jgi:hypothetical protein